MALAAIFSSTVLLTRCEQPMLEGSGTPNESNFITSFENVNYSVLDGRLVIADKTAAADLISAIVNNPEKVFNHFTSQTSFTSSRSAYINLMNDEENLSLRV
jgi:hypothetical protein